MEMHQLRYVVAVARTGNFSRAAESCHVSQPSLSQQIQKLEEELAVRLFDRLPREAKLTTQGERFLARAMKILEEADLAKRDVAECGGELHGTIVVGALPTIAPYLLPPVLIRFRERHPQVEVILNEDTTARQIAALLAYEVDVAIVSLPISEHRLQVIELFQEELLLAAPSAHPLAKRREICGADLANERLIVMKEGHCLGDQVVHFCSQAKVQTAIAIKSAQLETIQALVRSGIGISLVPGMAAQGSESESRYVRFKAPRPSRTIVALRSAQRAPSRAGEAFMDTLIAMSPELSRAGLP